MLKNVCSFLIAIVVAADLAAQVEPPKGWAAFVESRRMWQSTPMLEATLGNWDEMARTPAPPATELRELQASLTNIKGSLALLSAADVPASLQSDLSTAVQTLSAKLPQQPTMTQLATLTERSAKFAPLMEGRPAELATRLNGLQNALKAFNDIVELAGVRQSQISGVLRRMSANPTGPEKCVVEQVETVGSALAVSFKSLKDGIDALTGTLDVGGLTQQRLAAATSGYAKLVEIGRSIDQVEAALARIESLRKEKIDLSFRYWGKTAEGRFGEIPIPVILNSATLLKSGGEAIRTYVNAMPSPLPALAEAYGIGALVQAANNDVATITSNLANDLKFMSGPAADGLGELAAPIAAIEAGYDGLAVVGTTKFPVADPNAPNYGVLQTPPGFDYRELPNNLDLVDPRRLAATCPGWQ